MTPPQFIAFGEALTDFIRVDTDTWQSRPGGAGWNVARVVGRLGVGAAFAGAISDDLLGRQLLEASAAASLDTRFIQPLPYPPLLAMVPSSQPPSYFFVGDNSADLHFDPARLPPDGLDALRVAYFGSISLARPPLADRLLALAHELAARGVAIAFDPNMRSAMSEAGYRRRFEALAHLASYIKVSDEDLQQLFPALDQTHALETLRRIAPKANILFTRGADGMSLIGPDGVQEQPALPAAVSDTIGCGDASIGGLIASLLKHPARTMAEHLRFAAATAACTAGYAGAYAPDETMVNAKLALPSAA
ncbi:carbohydrate kinase [Chromobacterium vaccinii]|uniref:carbohydrate kinase family protein n=1 Tax=Chromobacterium vaccinii TaxID=1108595 RepID=UPI001E420A6F|nr:carbohydrate kinase [Chromobacterium vaccinii]MCD4487299.1 carbohydrate kinase [Chromobacterium vaccinii]